MQMSLVFSQPERSNFLPLFSSSAFLGLQSSFEKFNSSAPEFPLAKLHPRHFSSQRKRFFIGCKRFAVEFRMKKLGMSLLLNVLYACYIAVKELID